MSTLSALSQALDAMKNTKSKTNRKGKTLLELLEYEKPKTITELIGEEIVKNNPNDVINEKGLTSEEVSERADDGPMQLHKNGYNTAKDYVEAYDDLTGSVYNHIMKIAKWTNSGLKEKDIKDSLRFKNEEAKSKFISVVGKMHSVRLGNNGFVLMNELNLPISCFSLTANGDLISELSILTTCEKKYNDLKELIVETMETNTGSGLVTIIDDIGTTGLTVRKIVLKADEENSQSCFYPWMDGISPEEYMMDFVNSKEQLVLFYGFPGTGKSSFIKTAIAKLGMAAIVCAKAKLSADAGFVTSLLKYVSENPTIELVVIEDADALMVPRSQGNLAMNELLSALDGIGKMNFKLILTTNKDNTEGIDTALIRHGRAYDIMKFGRLKPKEAEVVREVMGLNYVKVKNPVTLAQAIAYETQGSMRSAENEEHAVVSPRFPLRD